MEKIKEKLQKVMSLVVDFLASDYGILVILLIAALCVIFGLGEHGTSSSLAFALVAGTAGGTHVTGEPLTTDLARQASPSLLRNEIDQRIVKIRPTATPIDQISRWGGSRPSGSMIVDYYLADTKPISTTLSEDYMSEETGSGDNPPVTLEVEDAAIFEASETVLVPSVEGTDREGNPNGALVLYVLNTNHDEGTITVMAINGTYSPSKHKTFVPDLEAGTELVRMGRAATELDVQTPQFEALPMKMQNYCQVFKTQVEQSTFQKIANKEVGWDFSDQEETAIIDMRLGMEKNFLFGKKAVITDTRKHGEVYLTGGIWDQTSRAYNYVRGGLTQDDIVGMTKEAFTQNVGSARKILIGGTGLIEALNKLDYTKVVFATDKVTHWGIDFDEIRSKFGTLYVLHSEIFDQCGHTDDGFIIDPNFIQKYCHVPFRADRLDLKKSGVRNTDAVVVTEASCLVLRYPSAHIRVVATESANNNANPNS